MNSKQIVARAEAIDFENDPEALGKAGDCLEELRKIKARTIEPGALEELTADMGRVVDLVRPYAEEDSLDAFLAEDDGAAEIVDDFEAIRRKEAEEESKRAEAQAEAEARDRAEAEAAEKNRVKRTEEKIAALVKLAGLEYETKAKAAAKEFGVKRQAIDEEVKKWRQEHRPEDQEDNDIQLAIWEMNAKHSVIGNLGGKCIVMEWVRSDIHKGLLVPSYQAPGALKDRYANKYISVEGEPKQLGAFWFKHRDRKTHEGLALVPNGPQILPGNVLNLWKGFGVEPRSGDWSLMQRHIREVLANGDGDICDYIVRWAAWAVQHPDEQAEVALVIRGRKGAGKGAFFNALRRLFGNHGLHIASSQHLVGQFNVHLQNCIFLFADEAFWAGDKQGESKLKALITEAALMIEPKGINPFQWKNRLHIGMAANAKWVVPASHDERRYVVIDCNDDPRDDEYFKALFGQLKNGGLEAMLYDFLKMDLGNWHPRKIIRTEALRLQQEHSMSFEDQWWESLLQDGLLPGAVPGWHDRATTSALVQDFHKRLPEARHFTEKAMALFLKEHKCTRWRNKAARGWTFPPLKEARAVWEARYGPWPWHEDIHEWERFVTNPQNIIL